MYGIVNLLKTGNYKDFNKFKKDIKQQTSLFFSPEQTISRSSPVPVPEIADIAIGENLVDQQKIS